MPDPLFTADQLRARLSSLAVDRIYDDNGDGNADADPLTQLQRDASSKVRGHLGPVYDTALLTPGASDELVRIALDVAHAMAAQRHPEVLRIDGYRMMEQAEKELKKLREGVTNLGIETSPEPAANQGGEALSGNPDDPEPLKRFSDNWGDF